MNTYIVTARKGTQEKVLEVAAGKAETAEKKFLRTHTGYDEIRIRRK